MCLLQINNIYDIINGIITGSLSLQTFILLTSYITKALMVFFSFLLLHFKKICLLLSCLSVTKIYDFFLFDFPFFALKCIRIPAIYKSISTHITDIIVQIYTKLQYIGNITLWMSPECPYICLFSYEVMYFSVSGKDIILARV